MLHVSDTLLVMSNYLIAYAHDKPRPSLKLMGEDLGIFQVFRPKMKSKHFLYKDKDAVQTPRCAHYCLIV